MEIRDSERILQWTQRLNLFTNRLVLASQILVLKSYKDGWRGDVAFDGTPIPAAKKGTTKNGHLAWSKLDVGWYGYDGERKEVEGKQATNKLMWAHESTIATQTFAP